MHSKHSTRSLLLVLAFLIAAVCLYLFFWALTGGSGARGGAGGNASPLTVEEKAEVLHSFTQTSEQNTAVTPSEAAERLRTLENVAQSSSDSPAAKQSDADKLKVLRSLQSQ
jgi:hypothetical protein